MPLNFKTTADIKIAKNLPDQVIGQDDAVNIIKKAAVHRRHVLLIGEPGIGKSMLGMALAELLPKEKLMDTVSFQNPNDENQPLIRTMPGGEGRKLVMRAQIESQRIFKSQNIEPIPCDDTPVNVKLSARPVSKIRLHRWFDFVLR